MKSWRELKKLPRELWILCAASLVNRMGTMVLPFLVLYLTRGLSFSAGRAGAALAIYGGVALLIGPLAGHWSDRVGPVRLMEGGLFASGLLLLIFPLAHSWTPVVTMIVLFATATETFRPANMSLIGELAPAELRKPAFALHRWAVNLGMSVGPAIGGFLAQRSFGLLFFVDGMSTLAAVAILFFSRFHTTVRGRETHAPRDEVLWPLAAFIKDSEFRYFLLAILPVSLVFFQHEGPMPLFLVRDLHFSESAYGLFFTLNTLLIITLEIPLNAATAHWSFRRTLGLGASLFAVGFGALAVSHTYFEVAITVVIWTFGEMILFPSMSAYVSQIAPKQRHGEYMGLYMMMFSFAFTLGPWIGTLALVHWGSMTLWISTLIAGFCSAGILGRVRPQGREQRSSFKS